MLYIPTYKFSQDHLEMLFSVIRSHGGCNNNPTANQFKTALKKIISHAELSIPTTGNCIPIEDIAILHTSSNISAKKSISIINNNTS